MKCTSLFLLIMIILKGLSPCWGMIKAEVEEKKQSIVVPQQHISRGVISPALPSNLKVEANNKDQSTSPPQQRTSQSIFLTQPSENTSVKNLTLLPCRDAVVLLKDKHSLSPIPHPSFEHNPFDKLPRDVATLILGYLSSTPPDIFHLLATCQGNHTRLKDSVPELNFQDYKPLFIDFRGIIFLGKHLRVLNLQNCGLSKLPLIIADLPNLQILDLSENQFEERTLPTIVCILHNLRQLKANNCGLKSLHPEMTRLTNLQVLSLDYNTFTAGFLPLVIGSLTNLRKLEVVKCDLMQLPQQMTQLTNLQELNLKGNNFQYCNEFHAEPLFIISWLTSLSHLNMSNCSLQILPSTFTQLTNLKELLLAVNNFERQLPSVIPLLTSLRRLNVTYCNLRSLPSEIRQLTKLEELKFHLKKEPILNLTDLVEEFKFHLEKRSQFDITALKNLKILEAYGCDFQSLPPDIMQLTKLEEISLDSSAFEAARLPSEILPLRNVTALSLQYCNLTSLPDDLEQMTNLQKLNLSDNKFAEGNLPPVILLLTNLKNFKYKLLQVKKFARTNETVSKA